METSKSRCSPGFNFLTTYVFLIYINDICSNLSTNVKHFADDTSVFINLSNDLCIVSNWAYQWKMPSKQALEVISVAPCSNF